MDGRGALGQLGKCRAVEVARLVSTVSGCTNNHGGRSLTRGGRFAIDTVLT